jgi:uncharacterized membrane protein (UPF0127 family)
MLKLKKIMPYFRFFVFLTLIISCVKDNSAATKFKDYKQGEITLPSGKILKVYIADSDDKQQLGLSHLKPEDFQDDETMIFLDEVPSFRQFWMPDTHFNLDIIFMNHEFEILDIHKNLEHFPKREPNHLIPRSKRVYSQHVLEIKSSSPLALEFKIGMKLNWTRGQNHLQK